MDQKYSANSTEEERREAEEIRARYLKKTNPQEIIQSYSETSGQYEKYVEVIQFTGHIETAVTIAKLFPSNREDVNILDIAAGTGLCAVELKKHGFRKMDALEASKEMLEKAEEKNLYGRYIFAILGDSTLDIEDDTYDVISISGLSSEILKVLPKKAFGEMVRVVKPGGFVVNTTFHAAFDGDFLKNIKALESEGLWKQVEFRRFPGFSYGKDGAVSVHRVC